MSSFVVYVDESGDEGFKFSEQPGGQGSSEWFVIACAITIKADDLDTVKLVEKVRDKIRWQRNQQRRLHFSKLSHIDRLMLLNEIAAAPIKAITIAVHKPSLTNRKAFMQPNVLYHYTARYLLERVSWCCKALYTDDTGGDGSAEIHFSNRATLRMDEFKKYLLKLYGRPEVRIDWSIVKPEQCQILMPKQDMGQQIADGIASAFSYSLRDRTGTQSVYASTLKPVVYNEDEKYDGCGIKIWPREYHDSLSQAQLWSWLQGVYDFGT